MILNPSANSVVVLDFETTGLSVAQGARAIEIGAVKLVDGEVVDTFQSLMNPGVLVDSFIEDFTGISNEMLSTARANEEVMASFAQFIIGSHLLAHNASFDRSFLDAELARISRTREADFMCSLLISRRIYPDLTSHKLSSLVAAKKINHHGVFHRALADAEMTAALWQVMLADLSQQYGINRPTVEMMLGLQKQPKAKVSRFLAALE
ncbi:DNA polymerase III PolC-type [Sinobacterium norvegicum]|uniref:DNA-directed DNA polymerase n=1 Tax=Sinobacterium norvegicum TaxID=1641715 RepID=A0ABM9AB66_9GAMM|nr:3'-5' exonuclease [Sinobacterium norvegicum]CAH0990451.1 DNA polymerase III PolC-type [Sinobacterium norvegicum]